MVRFLKFFLNKLLLLLLLLLLSSKDCFSSILIVLVVVVVGDVFGFSSFSLACDALSVDVIVTISAFDSMQ